MYYQYWGLNKAPFDNVPDPSMYVESHSSVETAVAETVFAIEEGNECMAVIVGDVGSGKTLSLRLILDSIEQDKYRIALVTNPDMSFVELLKEIVGQLTGQECEIKKKVELLEVFNRILFKTADEGKKVVILIDEANAMSGPNLESLRLLTNMQDDDRNLFTLVLAGQMELARRLEHPRRANLYQRIGTYNRIQKIESVEKLKDYVQTRVFLAGGTQALFTDGAIATLWEHSGHGVPRLVNKICKLCLKAGETNGLRIVDGLLVDQVSDRFERLAPSAEPPDGRPSEQPRQEQATMLPEPRETMLVNEVAEETKRPGAPLRSVKSLETARAEVRRPSIPESVEQETHQDEEEGQETSWETDIGSFHIRIAIPSDVMQQAGSSPHEIRTKIAGSLAAQTLQKYPQLAFSAAHDPVSLWSDIRKSILAAMEQHTRNAAANG
jgi:type II secretory pathway predicted ATPase ExeA